MGADAHLDWRQAAASALAWWDEAGVGTLVEEQPRDWLGAATPTAAVPSAATPVVVAASPSTMPDDLDAFLRWRRAPEAPEAAWPGDWIPCSGPATAALMVLVDCPDRDDREALLSGAAGRLFERMLAGIGRDRDQVALAALCAKRPVAGRLPVALTAQLRSSRCITSAWSRRRVLLLGNAASRALLAMDVAPARGRLHALNHKGRQIEAVASFHPRFLIEKPAAKAAAWADLQLLRRGLGE